MANKKSQFVIVKPVPSDLRAFRSTLAKESGPQQRSRITRIYCLDRAGTRELILAPTHRTAHQNRGGFSVPKDDRRVCRKRPNRLCMNSSLLPGDRWLRRCCRQPRTRLCGCRWRGAHERRSFLTATSHRYLLL
jgi:hypothetical protein